MKSMASGIAYNSDMTEFPWKKLLVINRLTYSYVRRVRLCSRYCIAAVGSIFSEFPHSYPQGGGTN